MHGHLTADAIINVVRAARDDPAWSNDFDFLTVITDPSLPDISADDAATIVSALARFDTPRADGTRKRAAVVCSDELAAALLVYYEFRSKAERATDERFFRNEAEARAWLANPDRADDPRAGNTPAA